MLAAERKEIVKARDTGAASDEVLRAALAAVDQEESMLERVDELEALGEDRDLAPRRAGPACEHLAEAPVPSGPATANECPDCVSEGTTWVHLRRCLDCGAVGCCDSSPRRHAFRHYKATKHPVMRSVEPGEAWRWCFVDEVLG
jgi:CPA1 family monovalent cation:H+ antiporter